MLLDAGGSLTGDLNPAQKTQGASSVELLNRLGYDAMALGEADLALGPDVLAAREAETKFPLLSSNVRIAATGELVGRSYIIHEVSGFKVALVGVTGATEPIEGYTIEDPLAALEKLLPEVTRQTDAVIVLSHATPETNRRIADTFPDLTAIIAGGPDPSVEPWASEKTGVPVLQADVGSRGHAGRNVGVTTLSLDAAGKRISYEYRQIALGPDVTDDPETAAWVDNQ